MSVEAGKLKNEEEKKKKVEKEDLKKQEDKLQEARILKERNDILSISDKSLQDLESLLDKGIISENTFKDILKGKEISKTQIEEIFDKIDQIEDIKDIDKYLPKNLRISKEEYKQALEDTIVRTQVLTKINTALTIIVEQINPSSGIGLNLFSGFLTVLDKNLILVQENTIDIKDSLEDLNKKHETKKLSLWKKIINFFRDLFSSN
ncbi:MAG: hypothetical protein PHE25_06320 [Candidatus Gracilibacteria bacterium]|nr:hypothetical protein [Candidatus Gracilibacteria bacterium]